MHNSRNINAIIFDIGKVLIDYSFDLAFQIWADSMNISKQVVEQQFIFDSDFVKYEEGKITTDEFFTTVNQKFFSTLKIEDFKVGWASIYLSKFDRVSQLLVELKKNYILVALTNTSELHKPLWKKELSNEIRNFERIFCSDEIGCRKPDHQAYQTVLEFLNLSPQSVLFIDDNEENINSGILFGFNTILAENTSQILDELFKFGIAVDIDNEISVMPEFC